MKKYLILLTALAFITYYILRPPETGKKANVFISLHIDDQEVLSNVKAIDASLLDISPKFLEHLKPLPSLHVTLALINVKDNDLPTAENALIESAGIFRRYLNGSSFVMSFHGLGSFPNALFATLKTEHDRQSISRLHEILKMELAKRGFPLIGEYDAFRPHLTLVELTPDSAWLNQLWTPILDKWGDLGEQKHPSKHSQFRGTWTDHI